ncbi:MAG TPA: dipeptidase [Gemmatimonadales bacterium]|nr:dipeptidase [Gemmatimonadales bacterium]
MTRILQFAMVLAGTSSLAAQTYDPQLALARQILRTTPLIDGHNDLPWRIREDSSMSGNVEAYDLRKATPGHTDLARLRAGMVGAQFWSIYIPGGIKDSGFARVQLEQFDIARRVIAKYPEALRFVTTAAGIREAFAVRRIGSLLGLEGGHAIENSLGALRAYYDLGARYMTLTHNVTLDWADAALDQGRHGGLTPFGEEVVREMNRLGMLVDLSHVSPGTMSDAFEVSEAPVIFSHSAARALVNHARNVPDSILVRMATNGGLVMVPFVPSFLSAARRAWEDSSQAWRASHPRPSVTIKDVADHLDHIRRVAGADHVGIGADFDGIRDTVEGLEDVSTYPALFAELARRGWKAQDLRKVAGENMLRVLARAEQVARRLRRERPPSTRTIGELDRSVPSR